MNNDQRDTRGEHHDSLMSPHGALTVSPSGLVTPQADNGDGRQRLAVAGDGLAAAIVDAVRSGDCSALEVSAGYLSVWHAHEPSAVPDEQKAVPAVAVAVAVGGGGAHAVGVSRERAFAVDMTNWSVVVDGTVVVKVVGSWGGADRAARQLARISAGASPEASGAAIIPPLIGRLDWHHPERGTTTIATVSGLIEHAHDGWTWAVDDVLAFVAGGAAPEWPARLGKLTATLHRSLVSFAQQDSPRPSGAAMRTRAEATLEEALRVTHGDAGDRLRARVPTLKAAFAGIPDDAIGPVFDLHGDLHVGQILRSSSETERSQAPRYWVVDFDGDPQLSDAERDQPDFPARDLAHLLSSIDLVGAVAMKRLGAVDSVVLDWVTSANSQLLEGYRAALAEAPADGPSPRETFDERLLDGFIAEQLLRELVYADRFLPRWQYAPDAALTFRYQSSAPHDNGADQQHVSSSKEKPWTPPASTTT